MNSTTLDFIHPADKEALKTLKDIPGLDLLIKKILGLFSENQYRALCLATKIRLSPSQLPDLYNKLPPICDRLGISIPEFYLEADVNPNASAFGDTNPIICVTSGLISSVTEEEIESVIAHECGHIACHHMLYHTLSRILILCADSLDILGMAIKPLIWALLKWQRCSELSADRAAAFALRSAERVVNTQIRLSGGPTILTQHVNIDEFIKQADEFENYGSNILKSLLKNILALGETHPFAAVRVREIFKWSHSWEYRKHIKNNEVIDRSANQNICPCCGNEIEPEWAFCKKCGNKIR